MSYVEADLALSAGKFELMPGDILIGMTGYVGEVGLVPHAKVPPLLNQRVGRVVLECRGTSKAGFAYCTMRRPEFKEQVASMAHGTAQANVSAAGILAVRIVIPPTVIQDAFNRLGSTLLDHILCNHAESQKLAALRDYLLPKLLSGEVCGRHSCLNSCFPSEAGQTDI